MVKIEKITAVNKVVKMKKERRNMVASVLGSIIGLAIFLIGFAGMLISIPLMLIIVGFFTFFGFAIVVALGIAIISFSVYKAEEISCPYCREKQVVNFGLVSLQYRKGYKCKVCHGVIGFK